MTHEHAIVEYANWMAKVWKANAERNEKLDNWNREPKMTDVYRKEIEDQIKAHQEQIDRLGKKLHENIKRKLEIIVLSISARKS